MNYSPFRFKMQLLLSVKANILIMFSNFIFLTKRESSIIIKQMSKSKIKGKIIIITGGSSGIGKKLKQYYQSDNTVISLSRTAVFPDIRCDLSDIESIQKAVDEIKIRFQKVDVLINNAGYGLYGATELLESEEIAKQFATNVIGAIELTRALLPIMLSGAKIVNISSACALFPLPFRTMYCASKSALSQFSHCLKMELYPYGIDVTAICPGDIKSDFTKNRVKNYSTNERYGDRVKLADGKITSRENKRMDEDYAVGKIAAIINKKSYKPMYIVGNKYKFLYFMYRIVPHSLFMKITRKIFS